jgi:hypothetical protein
MTRHADTSSLAFYFVSIWNGCCLCAWNRTGGEGSEYKAEEVRRKEVVPEECVTGRES